MKRTIITLTATLAAFGLAILLGAPKAHLTDTSAAFAAPTPAPLAEPMPNRCPNIHEAIESLRSAEETLHNAAHDFCGHKVQAMHTVHEAIEELRAAEGCAKCK